ncbi:MAG: cadmium-translocating P-type ATPase [Chloroflexota bacterium]|nr:MAG: cadmium-translocating P-type ATPase [Chloroflexota bacterium]
MVETKTLDIPVILPENGECERCVHRLKDSLALVKGVTVADADMVNSTLTISYDPNLVSIARLEGLARDLGAGISHRFVHESWRLDSLDCPDCAAALEKSLAQLPGVLWASVNYAAMRVSTEYESNPSTRESILERVRQLGYDVQEAEHDDGRRTVTFKVSNMDCADCASKLEQTVAHVRGVLATDVSFTTAKMRVTYDATQTDLERISRVGQELGYGMIVDNNQAQSRPSAKRWWRRSRDISTAFSGAMVILGLLFGYLGMPTFSIAFYALGIVVGGYHVARGGIVAFVSARTVDMNLLMTIAVLGAIGLGEWLEGTLVVFLFALGNSLEGYTVRRARRAIEQLVDISPKEATLKTPDGEVRLPVEAIDVDQVIVVRPGERIGLDGQVLEGCSTVNEAPITGESMPVEKTTGNQVYAGTINQRGWLEVRVTRKSSDTTLSKIIHLVEQAQSQKAPTERFVNRFARYYTPTVVSGALLLATLPPLLFGEPFSLWVYRALVLLVISCPCSLVISTPVSIVSAIASAAANGILLKGGAYLEQAGSLLAIAFDKTGTLTMGRPEVVEVVPLNGVSADEVVSLAAAVEARSEHPLAQAILRRAGKDGEACSDTCACGGAATHEHLEQKAEGLAEVADFEAIAARGARATVDGRQCFVGSPSLFDELGVSTSAIQQTLIDQQSLGRTSVLVGTRSEVLGLIAIADRVRPEAPEALRQLRHAGIARLVMLTGDSEPVARAIGDDLGIDEIRAHLLPQDKVEAVKELRQKYGHIGMVGDGVNDAPALAAADVGIAMGAIGSGVALETADMALIADDLTKLPFAIRVSKAARLTIVQNIAFSLIVKAAFVALAATGVVSLWLAVLADVGTSLVVILNGMRLLRLRDQSIHPSAEPDCSCGSCQTLTGPAGMVSKH